VSAGIGIIGAASGMLQETFGGKLLGDGALTFAQLSPEQKTKIAVIGAGFVGLFSLFNIGGRFFWASLSDKIGRKATYFVFFTLGALCYAALSTLAGFPTAFAFAASFCIIASMYGGGFATIPAYLADMFGTQFVGAIHGRLLTAWSTAGIVGPFIVNFLHDTRINEKVPIDHVYDLIFYVLTGLLIVGFIANMLITPVASKWFMSDEEVKALQAKARAADATQTHGHFGIGLGALDAKAGLAWACVGIPLAYGVYMTLLNVAKIAG
jgi:MFS family permease